jgi:hypothetical protein
VGLMDTQEFKKFLRENNFKTEDTHTFWEAVKGSFLIEVMIFNLDTVKIRVFKNEGYNLVYESESDNLGAYYSIIEYANPLTSII